MEKEKHLEDLRSIRNIMEQSSRFISLSGLSGLFAGVSALLGAGYMYWYYGFKFYPYYEQVYQNNGLPKMDHLLTIITVAAIVLLSALSFGIYFTMKNARKNNTPIWGKTSKLMLINLAIPLITGGLFCMVLAVNNTVYLIAPSTLIFYGLALLNASKYTLNDIRYLGIIEILLGFIGCIFTGYNLLIWAIGFGVLHILYGLIMYRKYEK